MTLKDLYAQIGGDYDEAISRLRMERLVERFILRFLDDHSCQELIDAWASGDEDTSFKAAHTAKGVCANLSLTKLQDLSSQICEALRPGNEELKARTDITVLVEELKSAYAVAVNGIEAYKAEH